MSKTPSHWPLFRVTGSVAEVQEEDDIVLRVFNIQASSRLRTAINIGHVINVLDHVNLTGTCSGRFDCLLQCSQL